MKLLVEIKEEKTAFIMELLQSFKFVKTKPLTKADVDMLEGIKEAVDEVNEIKAGKSKSQSLKQFLSLL
jgi:hypothetical protein